jgi:hypothetical protein
VNYIIHEALPFQEDMLDLWFHILALPFTQANPFFGVAIQTGWKCRQRFTFFSLFDLERCHLVLVANGLFWDHV